MIPDKEVPASINAKEVEFDRPLGRIEAISPRNGSGGVQIHGSLLRHIHFCVE